jgi:beta-lactamase regulating signal transducer with metallopeptidase domain
MSALVETLAWTGALIALVLMLRRPVAKWCGPQCAYALWALPAIRLVLPPLTLPAWMAPQAALPAAAPAAAPLAEPFAVAAMPAASPMPASVEAGFDLFAFIDALPLAETILVVWLGGAAVFLWRRFGAYFSLRDELLAEGREVGRIRAPLGTIRLVETPGTLAPLAFGVLDPVIALPPGFMALPDRCARDLALAHEVAHHRGGDLLINVAVQPLFALHWFNPLGHYGWLALRRDQEAACDARVIAQKSAEERAAYGRLIAGFAAGPNLALAAPMACPVLGEKSIIQRLRSLSMSHLSFRRRLAGRALLAAGVLALPLTATISYAASESAQEIPEPPAPPAPPAPPEPPLPPEAPMPPEPPAAPEGAEQVEVIERVIKGEDGQDKRVRMVIRRAPDGAALDETLGELEGHEEMLAGMREGLAEADKALADMPRILEEALAEAEGAREAGRQRVIVRHECKPGSDEVSETTTKGDTQVVSICQSRVYASARKGLVEARAEIAADKSIPEDTRKSILQELDRTIARWSDKEG